MEIAEVDLLLYDHVQVSSTTHAFTFFALNMLLTPIEKVQRQKNSTSPNTSHIPMICSHARKNYVTGIWCCSLKSGLVMSDTAAYDYVLSSLVASPLGLLIRLQ